MKPKPPQQITPPKGRTVTPLPTGVQYARLRALWAALNAPHRQIILNLARSLKRDQERAARLLMSDEQIKLPKYRKRRMDR